LILLVGKFDRSREIIQEGAFDKLTIVFRPLYQSERTKPSFSSLAYAANYYDQSDLNFHFKAKTGLTPSELFGNLQTIEKGLYWSLSQKSKTGSGP
jgi:AraC-like DNA-binding protein